MSRAAVLLHLQRSPADLQQLLAWYKIRDMLLGQNCVEQDSTKALELTYVCEHPNAVWLRKLFAGRDVLSHDEARQVFLCCENDPRALCLAGVLGGTSDEVRRAADLGDAFAQARMTRLTVDGQRFRWAETSASQGERDGLFHFGYCFQYGIGCKKDLERAKANFLVAAELGHVAAMEDFAEILDKDDLQRFVWLGRAAAAANGDSSIFFNETSDQIRNFNCGAGHAESCLSSGEV